MTRTMYIAAVFLATLSFAQANQCANGAGVCIGDHAPQNIVSMLQTKLQTNVLDNDGQEEASSEASNGEKNRNKHELDIATLKHPQAMLSEFESMVFSGETPAFAVISQIKKLIENEMEPGLANMKNLTAQEILDSSQAIQLCNDEFKEKEVSIKDGMQVSVNDARVLHAACRDSEKEIYEHNLTNGDSYCVRLGSFLHEAAQITLHIPDASTRDASVQYVEQASTTNMCKRSEVRALADNCTAKEEELQSKSSECSMKQGLFEVDFCTWKTQLEANCETLDVCHAAAVTAYDRQVAKTQTLMQKWDYEIASLRKILCYCNAWLSDIDAGDNRSQHNSSQFQVCRDETYSPPPVDYGTRHNKVACVLTSVANHPGTSGFITQEYANFVDFVKEVVPCPRGATDAPTAAPITTQAPTTGTPTTEAPTTEAPTTKAPTTEAPTTEAPTTEAPTTEASFPTKQLGQAPPSSSHGLVLGSADFTFTATVTITSEGGYPNILLARHTNGVASGWTFGFQSCWTHQCDLDNPILLGRIQFQTWAINGAYNGQGGFSVDSVISLNQAYRISFLRCGAAFELWIDGVKQTLDTGSFDASSFEDVSGNGDAEIRLGTWFGGIQFRGTITDAEMNGFCNIAAAKAR